MRAVTHRAGRDHPDTEQPNAQAKREVGLENGENGQHQALYEEDFIDDKRHQDSFVGEGVVECDRQTCRSTAFVLALSRRDIDVRRIVAQHARVWNDGDVDPRDRTVVSLVHEGLVGPHAWREGQRRLSEEACNPNGF